MSGNGQVGSVLVTTSTDGGHSIKAVAQRCIDKIIVISETAPEPIRLQAEAFKERLRNTVEFYFRQMALSDRTTVIAELEKHGLTAAVDVVRGIEV